MQAYADVVNVLKGESEELMSKLLQIILTTVERWCERKGISSNAYKMVVVLFTRKMKLNNWNFLA